MVSVIITTYGGGDKLNRAINSVLKQDYQDLEVIVVDDNNEGSDGRVKTEKVMKAFSEYPQVIYEKHKVNKNGACARNTGAKLSKGEYLAFLDDDDVFTSQKISNSIECMKKNEDAIAACGSVAIVYGKMIDSLVLKKNTEFITSKDLLLNALVIGTGSNIFVKRDAYFKVDGFDERFRRYQDLEFMIRISEIGRIACFDNINIIKDCSGIRKNSYISVRESNKLFEDKFKIVIDCLSERERCDYYYYNSLSLYDLAKLSCERHNIEEACMVINQYGELPKKERFKCKIMGFYLMMLKIKVALKYGRLSFLYEKLREIKAYSNNQRNKKIIGKNDYEVIRLVLEE